LFGTQFTYARGSCPKIVSRARGAQRYSKRSTSRCERLKSRSPTRFLIRENVFHPSIAAVVRGNRLLLDIVYTSYLIQIYKRPAGDTRSNLIHIRLPGLKIFFRTFDLQKYRPENTSNTKAEAVVYPSFQNLRMCASSVFNVFQNVYVSRRHVRIKYLPRLG